jgi:YHS domain-containing protein
MKKWLCTKLTDRVLGAETYCNKEAEYHASKNGVNHYFCKEHWEEFLDLPTRRRKNAGNNTRLASVGGCR